MSAVTQHTHTHTQQAHGSTLVTFIERAAMDPGFSLEKFEALLRLQREEQARLAEREFNRAMAEAQGEMEPVRKGAMNLHTRSKYARFEDIDMMLKPIYTRHGFSVRFRTEDPSQPGWVKVVCVVAHSAGHIETFPLQAPLDSAGSGGKTNKTDVQAIGSTTSYLKRYLLTLAWNVSIAGDDDDGEGSRGQPQARPQRQQQHAGPDRRAEMDRTLRGDDIPEDFGAPKQDRLLKVAKRFGERMVEVRAKLESEGVEAAQEQYNGIMGNEGLRAEWNKIRIERPDLDQGMRDEASDTLKLIVADAEMGDAGEP